MCVYVCVLVCVCECVRARVCVCVCVCVRKCGLHLCKLVFRKKLVIKK